jgi:excisionase family DNA binding protein
MTKAKLTVSEAAEQLGVSRFTVRSWLRQRRLAYLKVGRRIVVDRADVEAFLRGCRVEARQNPTRGTRT